MKWKTCSIGIPKPSDGLGGKAILKTHSKNVLPAPDVDLHKVTGRTPGFAGSDLATLINEAALLICPEKKV